MTLKEYATIVIVSSLLISLMIKAMGGSLSVQIRKDLSQRERDCTRVECSSITEGYQCRFKTNAGMCLAKTQEDIDAYCDTYRI